MRRRSSLPVPAFAFPALMLAATIAVAAPAIAAPDTTIQSGPPAVTSATTAAFTFTSDTGVAFECDLDNGGFAGCTSPNTTPPLAEGTHTFSVRAVDASAVVDPTPATQAWTVDFTPPTTSIAAPPTNSQLTMNPTPRFYFTSTDLNPVTTFCSVAGDPFIVCTSPFTTRTLTDGVYVVSVYGKDAAGNTGPIDFFAFTIDSVAPAVSIVAGPTGTTNVATPTFKFTRSADAVSSLCAIDNVGFVACNPDPASYTASPLPSGPHTFYVKALDAAGNEATATRSFTVDLDPPDVVILNGPASRTNQTIASFDFASELGTTFQCRLDLGGFGPCSGLTESVGSQQIGHHTTGTLDEGFHTFEVRATDAAGNVDPTPASLTWFVDLTPPVAVIATKPSDPSNQATPLFAFTSEVGATYECQLDGAGFAPCPDTYVPASPLGSGSHTIEVRAIDAAGNAQVAPTQYTWMVDVTPPDTFLVQLGPVPSGAVVDFTLTSTEPATFECNLDGAGFVACPSAFETPALAEGEHTLVVRATDAAGNTDPTPATQTWLVDTVPPDTFILEAPPTISHQAIATFQFIANEVPVIFECSLDGAAFEACSNPVITPALADGPHTFAVRATDAANRTDETPAVHAWTIALGASLCDGGPFVCKGPGSTKLTIRNSTKDTADKLEFRWALGDATTVAELGDPSVDTEYAVCVWDTAGGVPSLVMAMQAPPAGNCAGKPCWRSLHDGTAFRYKDFGLLPDGVQQLTVRSGPLGKASLSVKGRGLALPDPPMPFTQQPSIVVQVVNGLGTCWGADYVVAPRTNTAAKLLVEEKP